MIKADKRILEIWYHSFYLWYTMNNTQHTYADFLQLPYLLQTTKNYVPEIIENVWKEHLLTNPAPPTDDECLLAMAYESKLFKCSTRMFNPFYKLKGKDRRRKLLAFRNIKVQLTPKITHETFHRHLLDFIKEACYTFSNINALFRGLK